MYIGRLLVVAPDSGAYRVSSRSFPHRKMVGRDGAVAVVPTAEAEPTDNPYVSYHCLREHNGTVTIGNGSHVDPIAEKLELGYPPRDALVTALHALDFEKDDYDTPRIAGVLDGESAHVGIVRRDALRVEQVADPTLIATYELDEPTAIDIDWETATEAAREAYALEYEHPICAVGVEVDDDGIGTGIFNGPGST